MRTWGRVYDRLTGAASWREVQTDPQGFDDYVWLTTLAQTLKLSWGESPFFADYGIPAQQAVIQQIFPDFYAALTQQKFSGYFAALGISKVPGDIPHYRVNVTTHFGVKLGIQIIDGEITQGPPA